MSDRALNAIIDVCVLLDNHVRWRWVDSLFLWAWAQQQAHITAADAAWEAE